MTHAERKAMRDKHHLYYEEDLVECVACSTPEDSVEWPCDVIKVLDALDEADRRAVANYERGYDDGYKGSVADAEWDDWTDGNDD